MNDEATPDQESDGRDAVLAANLAFYGAFAARDVEAMERIWAESVPVACIHPGCQPLTDRAAVMQSWVEILNSLDPPQVTCHDETVTFHGGIAVVICEEVLPSTTLVATNIFAWDSGAWRLIHHQASPAYVPESSRV